MALAFRQLRPSRHSTADPLRLNGSSESTAQPYHLGELESLSPPSHELPRKQRLRDKFRHMILFKDQGDSLDGSARNRKAQQIQHSSKPTPSIPAKHDVEEAAPTSIITEPDLSVYQREPSPAPNDAAITREWNAQSQQEPLDAEPTKGLSDVPTLNVNHAKLVTSFMRIVEDIKLIQIEHSEEFDEPLESEYGRARTGIFEYLCQAQSPLPTGSLQILRGNSKDGPSGRPCIRIIHGDFGDQKKLTNFHLKFSHQRKQYDPPFTICYQTLWDLSSVENQVAVAWSPSPDSLCGLLASAGAGDQRHHFTLGGLLQVEGRLHAVTAWHDRGITAEQSTTEPTQDVLERMVKTGELCGHLESPLVAARYHDQTEFEEDHDEFVNGDGLEFLKSAGSIRFTGSEWALIQVDNDFLKLPNCVRADVEPRPAHNNVIQETSIRPPQRALRYLTHAYKPGDMAQTSNVLVLAGVSGEIKATISRQLSAMRLDSGKVVQVWTLSFAGIKGSSLKKGDSGSWVVHPESGAVFGHIIAGTYRNAFVLPLDTIMREIGGCVLPTPFDCLADLARAYHTEGNTELAEQFAVKAMQENVLLVSSKGSELSRLIKARGRRPFDPSQPYSALQPAEVFRYVITRGGSTISETSEVISWLTSEETPFWYLALEDIHELLYELGFDPDIPDRKSLDKKSLWRGPNMPGHPFLTFTHIKAALRKEFLDSLTKSERTQIGQELEWIENVRRSILEEALNFNADGEDDVRVSHREWQMDVAQRISIQQDGQGRFATIQGSKSAKHASRGIFTEKSRSSGVIHDFKGKISEFSPNVTGIGGRLTDYVEFSCMKGLRNSDLKGTAIHVHLPANSVEWMNHVVKTLGANVSDDGQYWKSLQHGPVFLRQMKPICALVSSRSSFPDLILCIPYLRWERESHRESIAAWVKTEHNRRRSPVAQDEHGLNFSGRKSQMSSSQNERRFIPTKLGRLLLNAAALYEAISLDSEKQLLQNSLSRPEAFHLRRTLYQAYGTPQVDVDRSGLTSKFGSGNDNTNAVMVDQLWMRIIDGKTVVTSFPNNFGRDLADPTSIYHCIRQRLEEDAKLINIKAYDIALIVIEECLSSFFKQNQTPATAPAIAPGGISSISEIISSLASKTAYLCKRHRLHLLSETAVPPAILLQLFDARQHIEHILCDLSMMNQLLSEQDNVVEDFIVASASQPRRFPMSDAVETFGIAAEIFRSWEYPRDYPRSRYRIEPQLLKSLIRRHVCEVNSMIDTAKGIHRTILSLSRVSLDELAALGDVNVGFKLKVEMLPR